MPWPVSRLETGIELGLELVVRPLLPVVRPGRARSECGSPSPPPARSPSRTGNFIALGAWPSLPLVRPVPVQPVPEVGRRLHRRRETKGQGARSGGSGGQLPVGPSGSPCDWSVKATVGPAGIMPDYGAGASLGFEQACRARPWGGVVHPKGCRGQEPPGTALPQRRWVTCLMDGPQVGSPDPLRRRRHRVSVGLLVAGSFHLPLDGGRTATAQPTECGRSAGPGPSRGRRRIEDLSQAFAAVAEQVKPSVVYIKSGKKGRRDRAVGTPLPYATGIRAVLPAVAADAAEPRIPGERGLGLHRLLRRLHPDERSRRGWLGPGDRPPARPPRVQGQGGRNRSQHRPRRAEDRRRPSDAGAARQQRRVASG